MNPLYKISILCFWMFSGTILIGQVTLQPKQIDYSNKGLIYNQESTLDFKIHTNGFAIGFNKSLIKTYYKTTFWHIDFGEIKHIKEFRQQSFESIVFNKFSSSSSFILGKRNNFMLLRGGYGVKRYFSEKANHKGLAVGLSYEGGPSLGLLKPYYLDINFQIDNGTTYVTRSEKYRSDIHDIFLEPASIKGATGFSKGISETKLIPGLHAQIAAHFDWGAFDEFVKAIEAGIMLDVYFKEVPIMVQTGDLENQSVFINLFLNLQLGKRK